MHQMEESGGETILIVDDDKDHADALAYMLGREGYKTQWACCGREGIALATRDPIPDLVILDLMLPDLMGTEVCREIRQHENAYNMRVLMLTARTEVIDRVNGFEIGCDDYVTKPCSSRELTLRIKALLRRSQSEILANKNEIKFGILRIEPQEHRVLVKNKPIIITALEFRLLTTLFERRGRVQQREVLLTDVWGLEGHLTTRTTDTHVKRLREKLGAAGVYIETVRGVGYRFRTSPDEVSK